MAVNKSKLLTLFLTVLISLCDCELDQRIVTLKEGKIKGGLAPHYHGKEYFFFKGIPYAHVSARFAAPVPPLPWEGIRDATRHGPKCPQYNLIKQKFIAGDENCLFLNVYTKSLNPVSKTPVMFFIHGGSYMSGDGDEDMDGDSEGDLGPKFLLEHDVIVVTINYRLEALGFLCLDIPEVPGNAGMKDQVAALKWIKENIAKFGGDPDNITIFGESAGSSSVTQHLQSPLSKGLFNKAIAQSGVSIVDWAQGQKGKERALRAAKFLGHESKDATKVLEFLRSVPVEKLVNLTFNTLTEDEKYRDFPVSIIHFAPVVENKFDNVEAFMTEEAISSLSTGKLHKVPLMIGYNSDEALYTLDEAFSNLNFMNKNLQYLVPREIAQIVTEDKAKELGKEIRNFYVRNREFTKDDANSISDMFSDRYFVYSIHRFIHFYSKISTTFLYKFSCDTELNVAKKDTGYSHMKGAAHGDEIYYLFSNKYNKANLTDMVYRVTKIWADFAKTGNPTSSYDTKTLSWPPYTTSNKAFMNIDEVFTVGQNTEQDRVEFWDKMYCDAGVPCIAKNNV